MRVLLSSVLLSVLFASNASDLKISEPIFYNDEGVPYALMNVEWDNAWNNDTNHDGVWLFFKFLRGEQGYVHALVLADGNEVTQNHQGKAIIEVPNDRMGIFIKPSGTQRGKIHV